MMFVLWVILGVLCFTNAKLDKIIKILTEREELGKKSTETTKKLPNGKKQGRTK